MIIVIITKNYFLLIQTTTFWLIQTTEISPNKIIKFCNVHVIELHFIEMLTLLWSNPYA